jgi:hypothetical protein
MSLLQALALARELITAPGDAVMKRVFEGAPGSFLVDWREEDDRIVALAAEALGEKTLRAVQKGGGMQIKFKRKTVDVPLQGDGGDRHVTLLALNEAIAPDHEVRFIRASEGGDTIAFMALARHVWTGFETQLGDRVAAAFAKLTPEEPLFEAAGAADVVFKDTRQARFVKFERVYPRICTLEQTRGFTVGTEAPLVEPLAGDLAVAYFRDVEPAYLMVSEAELVEFGIDRAEFRKVVRGNALACWSGKVKFIERDGLTEMVGAAVVGGIDMTAALAINPSTWDLMEQYDGAILAAFPSRDRIFSVPAANPEAIATLRRELAAMDFTGPAALSPQLFARDGTGWKLHPG